MTTNETSQPPILHYQQDRTLDQVLGYRVGLQLCLSTGERVYIAMSATELALYFGENLAIHYDLEARLTRISEPNQYWRRSLSHRVLHSHKRTREEGGGLDRVVLAADRADTLVAEAHHKISALHHELQDGLAAIEFGKPDTAEALERITPILTRAAQFDIRTAHRDADRFRSIYGRVAVLPPDEYNALVLQATVGCAHNACTFCQLYRGVSFRAKKPDEFRQHVREVVAYHGESLRARRSIFLGEANALTLPLATLCEMFDIVRENLELPAEQERSVPASWWLGNPRRFDGIASFLDVFTERHRPAEDFMQLHGRGLRRVYIGMETGDDSLLRWLHKPGGTAAVVETVRALKAARIAVGVIVLLGAGGREFSTAHVRNTVRVINELNLQRGDYVYFSPLVIYPGAPYDAQALAKNVEPLTADEMKQQEQAIRTELRFDARRGQPYLARYELDTFVY